jgi:hypothetical protein
MEEEEEPEQRSRGRRFINKTEGEYPLAFL